MKILLCLDGEPHTRDAIEQAIAIGLSESAEVTALHVVDPWLEQFSSEIYAQGRKEYLEWVAECLKIEAMQTVEEFDELSRSRGLEADFKIRHGDPLTEILEEVREFAPDLVITGGKPLSAWGRFRSGNLPARLENALDGATSIVSVKTDGSENGLEAGLSIDRSRTELPV